VHLILDAALISTPAGNCIRPVVIITVSALGSAGTLTETSIPEVTQYFKSKPPHKTHTHECPKSAPQGDMHNSQCAKITSRQKLKSHNRLGLDGIRYHHHHHHHYHHHHHITTIWDVQIPGAKSVLPTTLLRWHS
jgi:hypothetical protein